MKINSSQNYYHTNIIPSTPTDIDIRQNVKNIYQHYSQELKKQILINQAKKEKEKKEQAVPCGSLVFENDKFNYSRSITPLNKSSYNERSNKFNKEDKTFERTLVDQSYNQFIAERQKAKEKYDQAKIKSKAIIKKEIEDKQKLSHNTKTQEVSKLKLEISSSLKNSIATQIHKNEIKQKAILDYREVLKKQIQEKYISNSREKKEYGQWGMLFNGSKSNTAGYQCISCKSSIQYH